MRNKVIVAVLILVLVFVYWYYIRTPALPAAEQEAVNIEAKALDSVSAGAVDTGSVVSVSVEKTNPFNAKVNPYDGYKNPFAQ